MEAKTLEALKKKWSDTLARLIHRDDQKYEKHLVNMELPAWKASNNHPPNYLELTKEHIKEKYENGE